MCWTLFGLGTSLNETDRKYLLHDTYALVEERQPRKSKCVNYRVLSTEKNNMKPGGMEGVGPLGRGSQEGPPGRWP